MADEQVPQDPVPQGRAGQRVKPPERPEPEALSTLQAAQRALATQGQAMTLAEALSEEQQAALAATLDDNGLATEETQKAVVKILDEVYKAAVDEGTAVPLIATVPPVADEPAAEDEV